MQKISPQRLSCQANPAYLWISWLRATSGSGLARLGQSWDLELELCFPSAAASCRDKTPLQRLAPAAYTSVAGERSMFCSCVYIWVWAPKPLSYCRKPLRRDAASIWQFVFMAWGFICFPLCPRANISHIIFSSLCFFSVSMCSRGSLWSLVEHQARWRLKSAYMTHNLVFIICVDLKKTM